MSINYDETVDKYDATGAIVQVPKWKFRPGQQLWWWDSGDLRLHPCTLIRADYQLAWSGGKWIIDYDGPAEIRVDGNDLYTTRKEAVAVSIAYLDHSLEISLRVQRKQARALNRAKHLLGV